MSEEYSSLIFICFSSYIQSKKSKVKEMAMVKKMKGLTHHEVEEARRQHGTNELRRVAGRGLIRSFFDNLGDPIIRILVIALALEVLFTFGNCNLIEVFGILAAILISAGVSTLSEYGSEKAFKRIEAETALTRVRVIRDGVTTQIPSSELVVGDIVLLSPGERIEADGVLLEGTLEVDQSALNGENKGARKVPGSRGGWDLSDEGRVYRGSIVTSGNGVMRVGRVGESTFYGMVARDVQTETRVSPLKLRLSHLASQISKIGYVVAALVGFTYLFNVFVVDNGFKLPLIAAAFADTRHLLTSLLHALTLMITVIVVAVPEGLPMMITVVLSANMKRMVRDNILVKKLVGIETAGSLNMLFTDKTGTLTEGRLTLDRVITEDKTYRNLNSLECSGAQYDALVLTAVYNTDAERSSSGPIGGNATDRAIAEFFCDAAAPIERIVDKTPFSSEIKYSSVTLGDGSTLIKGAPDIILPRCAYCLRTGGESVASDLSYVNRQYKEALSHGERIIAVAIDKGANSYSFVALIVLKDKIRDGVKEAVSSVMRAGIQIVMVTGDNKETAVHIAEECGFYKHTAGHVAIDSDALSKLTDDDVKRILPSLRVVARALPQDKSRLVRLSQELDQVVGMTGDGINDAPSLKLADVGFAMGSGTDIAKGAGDIIILDNSFRSISRTVLYGRTIFKSIRKFIAFQLIMNLAACGITLIGQFLGVDNPITIIQMLWVNIIMDTLGGLAFAGEPPLDYYMLEKPKRRDEPILSKAVLSHIILNGAFTLGLLVLFLRHPYFSSFYALRGTPGAHMTAFFALFIFAGLFNCFSARCERMWLFSNIGKNKPFILIMLFISVIQIFIIYLGGALFRSVPLAPIELWLAVLTASSVLMFDVARRVIAKLK